MDAEGRAPEAAEEIVAVLYNTHHDGGLFNQLQIEPNGSTWLIIQFASPQTPARMLGGYQASLGGSEPRVREVFDSIRNDRILDVEETTPSGSRVPAQAIMIARTEDDVKSFESGMGDSFEAPLAQLAKKLAYVVEATVPHPTATVGLECTLTHSEYRPGDRCEIHLHFENAGAIPVLFGNPRCRKEDVLSQLSLEWWTRGGEGAEDRVMVWDLGEAEWLTGPRQAVSSEEEMLQLPPKKFLDIELQWMMPRMEPGIYVVGAVLRSVNPGEEETPGFVEGLLRTEPQEIEILPRSD